jgi:hypoxanthine phosphoribosyltransferase
VKLSPDQARQLLSTAEQVCSAVDISDAVRRLAREITAGLQDRNPLVLGVMRGSVMFAGQLLPQLAFPLEFDYLDVTRYGKAINGGKLKWKASPGTAVGGRVVLVLDDILDEGYTLKAIRDKLLAAGAAEFHSAVFAEKDTGRVKPITANYVGVRLPNRYVFGFGMDVAGAWRNLPAIYALSDDQDYLSKVSE